MTIIAHRQTAIAHYLTAIATCLARIAHCATPIALCRTAIAHRSRCRRARSEILEQLNPRILVIQFSEFAHNFTASLVVQLRHHHINSNDLIAALAGYRR